jgi:predicted oxidoreductase
LRAQSITHVARAIYRAAYGEAMPKGWRVQWGGTRRRAMGVCEYRNKRIILVKKYLQPRRQRIAVNRVGHDVLEFAGFAYALDQWVADGDMLETLCHEFTHMRWPPRRGGKGLPHGAEFERLVKTAYERVWDAAR